MTHYYIKNCYIKNRTAFIMSILGCINREVDKIEKDSYSSCKRREFGEALSALSNMFIVALRVEKNTDYIINTYDGLEATFNGTFYSEIQERADDMVKFLEDDITIHFTGPFGEITTEYEEWLPDFHGKIKIVFE